MSDGKEKKRLISDEWLSQVKEQGGSKPFVIYANQDTVELIDRIIEWEYGKKS